MKIELKVDSVDWAPGNQNGMICCEWTVRIEAWIKDGEGNIIELAEGELARVIRNEKEIVVYCHEIIEGDEIVKY